MIYDMISYERAGVDIRILEAYDLRAVYTPHGSALSARSISTDDRALARSVNGALT